MSEMFCRTFETQTKDFKYRKVNQAEIELYKIELSIFQRSVSSLMKFLTPLEHNRANRYHFIKDKNRFIICRTILKLLLAERTGLDVDKIILGKDNNKKPYLPSHPSVCFNVTHAGDYAILAIAKEPVGVDIEYVDRNFDFNEILPGIFNKSEIDEVSSCNDNHHAFYKLWTRKEAIVKAIGTGIDDNFSEINSLDGYHHINPELLGNIKRLQVFSFELNEDYIGAVAFSGSYEYVDKLIFYTIPTELQELINT